MASRSTIAAALVAATLAACATPPTTNPDDLKSTRPGFVPGYLAQERLVDSVALLPAPPRAGSPEQAADDAAYRAAIAAKDSPRWQLAARDAVVLFPQAADAFSCALGMPIDAASSPHLTMLLRRTLADAGLATSAAKTKHQRARPFMANDGPMCTPADESFLRKDGSYPSGHAALGWAWGLVLIELAPERADEIARRAYAYGQSRVACGVHYPSDVAAGRSVGAIVVAQLHANADFRAQLREARREIAAARARQAAPNVDCAAEAAALAR